MDNSKSSSEDCTREALLWEEREEQLINKWLLKIKSQAILHKNQKKKYKNLYNMLGLPTTVLPIVIASLNPVIAPLPILSMTLLLSCGVITGTSQFLNYGKRYQRHSEFENKYSALANKIEMEISKPKHGRMPCDVFLQMTMMEYNHLNELAPDVKTIDNKK